MILIGTVAVLRTRTTDGWLRAITIGSGILIGAFGLIAIALAVRG